MWIKTNELTGKALDWIVAKCEGLEITIGKTEQGSKLAVLTPIDGLWRHFKPSTNWSQGGPIIEREKVALDFCHHDLVWFALIEYKTDKFKADNPLVAAMRCYVASKLGDEVEVPDELV